MKSSEWNKNLNNKTRKMYTHYTFGLFLIFLLSFSYCMASSETDNDDQSWKKWSDGDDDYYYDDSNELNATAINNLNNTNIQNSNNNSNNDSILSDSTFAKLQNTTSIIKEIPLVNNFLSLADIPKGYDPIEVEQCASECYCTDNFQYVNCSSRNLEKIPTNLPTEVLYIDLSHNYIDHINSNDFEKSIKLTEILLNDNQISQIDKEIFVGLRHLENINLASNRLSEIDPDAFSEVIDLVSLDLSNNPLVLKEDASLLNQPQLQDLNIQNTGLNEIYTNTFYNLSRLKSLKMDNNDFNQKINTKAFQPMQKLVKLRLPDLEEGLISELCQLLTSIDSISFKRYDISCFELGSGLSFNESLILPTNIPGSSDGTVKVPELNKGKQRIRNKNNMNASTTLPDTENNQNETITEIPVEKIDSNQIQISQQTINFILIGIMVFAIIGIMIGFICRKDYCGIKTKLCRTNKNRRPPPTDQVRPAEEIPLNKV